MVIGLIGDNIWRVHVDPLEEGGPYRITVTTEGCHPLTMDQVLAGDVWLCAGQSNMRFPMEPVGVQGSCLCFYIRSRSIICDNDLSTVIFWYIGLEAEFPIIFLLHRVNQVHENLFIALNQRPKLWKTIF